MIRFILLITLLLPLSSFAQKRNEIKFLGVEIDFLLKANGNNGPMFNNKFVGSVGYNRFIGSRLAVGFAYHHFLNFESTSSSINNDQIRYEFNEKAWGIDYHSRFFFSDYDNDGTNTGYIQFSLNRTNLKQTYTNIVEYDNNYWAAPNPRASFSNTYGVTRYGINLGLIDSDVITKDLSIGMYFNGSPSSTSPYSLTDIRGVSFMISYLIGVSF